MVNVHEHVSIVLRNGNRGPFWEASVAFIIHQCHRLFNRSLSEMYKICANLKRNFQQRQRSNIIKFNLVNDRVRNANETLARVRVGYAAVLLTKWQPVMHNKSTGI